MNDAPEVSFVIPVFDEESICTQAVVDLRERLAPHHLSYEIIWPKRLARRHGRARAAAGGALPPKSPRAKPHPHYGQALRGAFCARAASS